MQAIFTLNPYSRRFCFWIFFALCLGMGLQPLRAQQIAFPGAEGAGKFTSGGRGTPTTPTTVFEVTKLNDDGSAGTLRWALTQTATYRTIVFRVSGTIHLTSRLVIRGNTTIAGQTAPGGGICIADHATVISGNNVIVRYIRFRMGDKNQNKGYVDGSGGDDTFSGMDNTNVIIDHCSVSWSSDEAMTFYRGDNLTLQWNIISEPLNYSYHYESPGPDFQEHGYGGIWGGQNASFHHNLIAHAKGRMPRFSGSGSFGDGKTPGLENADFRNNVVYNWGSYSTNGGEGGNYNIVNNYYKYGPSTTTGTTSGVDRRNMIMNPSKSTELPYPKIYLDGNYVDNSSGISQSNWKGMAMASGTLADTAQSKVTSPFNLPAITTQSAQEAYELVLAGAGAVLPTRDTLDQRIINNVRNRTGRLIDVQGGYPHGTPYEQTVNAWPTLASGAAPVDTDKDGMPDSWETSNGLNPNDANDRNTYNAEGYTMLEVYLNSLTNAAANTSPGIYVTGSLNAFVQTVGTPSDVQTLLVSGVNLTNNITITSPANFEISIDGTTWFNSTQSIVLTQSNGVVTTTTLSVRLNAATAGSYSGSIQFASSGATTLSTAVSGAATTASSGTSAQLIGAFPDMDGGFENQTPGSYSTVTSHTSTTNWEASSNFQILNGGARTGSKVMHWNGASGSTKYLVSPVLTTSTLQAGTSYVVQFWYKKAASSGTGNLTLSGYNSIVGGMSGGAGTTTSQKAIVAHSEALADWVLFRGVMTTQSGVTVTNTYGGIKVENPQTPFFDVDDYVIYPGDVFDETAPNVVTAPTAGGNNTNNTITLNWSAPATGIDGGGYVVVRSTSSTAPVPNANGIYIIGNTMGDGNTVVYTGTSNSYVDNSGVAAGTTYYYYIFTVDKAFNFSAPVQVAGSLTSVAAPAVSVSGTLNAFSQITGTPSAVQTYTVSGSNLTGDITITPSANFEVSANGNTWFSNATPLTLAQTGGAVANTTISVRLNAATAGTFTGNIAHASSGASAVNVAVSGTATTPVVMPPFTPNVTVAKDGSGQYTTIQAAIDAAPTGRTTPYIIYIKNGKYKEKVSIPSNKPFIHLVGESVANTIITWDDYSGKPNPAGGTFGTSTSATVTISSNDCFVANITMENSTGYTGDGPQALAINVSGDRCAFKDCRFISGQDTVLANGDGKRQYFRNCYIDGNTDFIFGSSIAVFDSCIIFPRDRVDGANGGYVTAANTPQAQTYGYVFRDCKLTMNRGITLYTLGRPWQNDASTVDKKGNKTVFLNSYMGNSIKAEGWSMWDAGTNTSIITYAEYKTKKFDGTLANVSGRVSWSKQLTDAEAADYYDNTKVLGNWDPCTSSSSMCAGSATEIAVSNFRVKKGTSSTPSVISCNISWPIAGLRYELFKSPDNINFSKINELVVNNDTAVNFVHADAIPAGGSSYYYYIKASKDGMAAHITDTIQVSSIPTVSVSGSFKPFNQYYGSASSSQLVSVAGVNLIGNVTINPPANFQISVDNGSTWSGSTITLAPTSGTIASTNVLVRLNAPALGSYSDSLVLTSTGATRLAFLLSGSNVIYVAPTSVVLQQWPLTANGTDSAAVRSAGLTASTLSLNKLYTSNGTQVPGVTAYHPVTGMAYAASASGDGFWTSAVGGPGGNLNRTNYVQFTVTASSGYSVKVDSILLSNNIISSTSNTKIAVVYSKSNFVSDSFNVTGGLAFIPPADPAPLVSTANGGFTTPVVIAVTGSSSTGPTNRYAFALNDVTGVTLAAGETLTIRLYNSCGSTSAGRYGMLKDVIVKGTAADLNALPPAMTTTGTLSSFNQPLGSPSAHQTITLSGTNLTSNIMIVPPANFQVSPDAGTTWYGNTTPLMLNQSGGTLAATNILVRLNAAAVGSYTGNIIASANGVTREITVNGTTAVPVYPVITVTGTLANFAQTAGTPAAAQTFTVSGSNLTSAIVIAAPANYQVSFDGTSWADNLTITANNGTVAATTIHVRLNTSAAGTYTGNISLTSSGATSKSVVVNGTAVAPLPVVTVNGTLSSFAQTIGSPSAVQTITVAGTNLTGNISITPATGYEVSANGTTWFNNADLLVISPVNGAVAATTVSVRLNATAAGNYAGNIEVVSSGATAQNKAVTGTAVLAPVITVNNNLVSFTQTLGTASVSQTFTVSGSNLTSVVKVLKPADFEISLNGSVWTDTVLTLTPANGVVNASIMVRMNAKATGSINGSVTLTSTGANNANVALTGTTYALLTVSPNPAKSFIQVHHPKFYTVGTLTIYNLNGVKLASFQTVSATDKTEIQVGHLPAGIYVIEYQGLKGNATMRFIKE